MYRSSRDHYEELLARRYTWLYGGFAERLAEAEAFFQAHGIHTAAGLRAADLGAGSGFQSVALARAGYRVESVDLSATLLAELRGHADEYGLSAGPEATASAVIQTFEADLVEYLARPGNGAGYELLVCMGDTLPHLPSFSAVTELLRLASTTLEAGGKLILGFRDLSTALDGVDRFIPVRSDDERIFSCFLDYVSEESVLVHDLIYERAADQSWSLHKSCYRKLRISSAWVNEELSRLGFHTVHTETVRGFVAIIASLQPAT